MEREIKREPISVRKAIQLLAPILSTLFIVYGRSLGAPSQEALMGAKLRDALMLMERMHQQSDSDPYHLVGYSLTDNFGHPLPQGGDGKIPTDSHSLDGVLRRKDKDEEEA